MVNITIRNLPKSSFNKLYSGMHWSKRHRLKNQYKLIIKSQFSGVFTKDCKHEVSFKFYFKSRPLDADNCATAIKIINDVIFEDDAWDIMRIGGIDSFKDKDERVEITVKEIS